MPQTSAELSRGRTAGRLARGALRWSERGLAIFGASVIVYWLTLDVSIVVSPSMSPTLEGTSIDNGDRVVTEKVSLRLRSPRRWEVITFTAKSGEKRMKRVVGLPGENVQMRDGGELLIDGQSVDVPPMLDRKYLRYGNLMADKPIACGDGYYVLGDFLRDSDDSRFDGPIAASSILGRAWLIVGPIERFGFVR